MPTFRDLKTYLERDGDWEEIPNLARGRRRVGDHWRYRKTLPDGTVLRTKVSHALGEEIGADLFSHILRDQLRTTMEHFRDVLAGRATNEEAASEDRPEPIPGWLVTRLLYTVGLPEGDVRQMTAEEARACGRRTRAARARPDYGAEGDGRMLHNCALRSLPHARYHSARPDLHVKQVL